MLDGRVSEASQVQYKPFGKLPLQREPIAQVDGLLAGKLGVTEAASVQIAVRFPDDGGADEVVAP